MRFVLVALLTLSASFAYGGKMKMKKAIKKAQKTITKVEGQLNKACGSKIKIISEHSNAAKFTVEGRDKYNLVSTAASICEDHVESLRDWCKKDADYKEVIAALKTVKCFPDTAIGKKDKYIKTKYQEKKQELSIKHHPVRIDNPASYDAIENAF